MLGLIQMLMCKNWISQRRCVNCLSLFTIFQNLCAKSCLTRTAYTALYYTNLPPKDRSFSFLRSLSLLPQKSEVFLSLTAPEHALPIPSLSPWFLYWIALFQRTEYVQQSLDWFYFQPILFYCFPGCWEVSSVTLVLFSSLFQFALHVKLLPEIRLSSF